MKSKDATRWELIDIDILQRPAGDSVLGEGRAADRGGYRRVLSRDAADGESSDFDRADARDLRQSTEGLRVLLRGFEAMTYQPSDQPQQYKV